jgi:hypothetical protein
LSRLFRFVQFELAGRVGPAPGRYVVRRYAGDEASWIVVVSGHETERRWFGTRRRARPAPPGALADAVDVTRFTLIDARPLARGAMPRDPEAEVAPALAVLNRTLSLHRLAIVDPYVHEIRRETALRVRVGYGAGESVAEGRWEEAIELPHPKPRRSGLAPQERLAALLSARDVGLTCEELALRAEADLAAQRLREAALEVRNALAAGTLELQAYATITGMPERIAELVELLAEVGPVADTAFGAWEDTDAATGLVTHALGRLQAALRARRAASGI